uniref:FBD domain-containing protein n=1 Tax=Aegilops tauschii subsp. strangulata TaxID=200361 RepID=A0A453F0F0_AEGTS
SSPSESPTNVDVDFWDQVGHTECVTSHIKKFVFEAARGEDTELAFVKFVMERAQMLEMLAWWWRGKTCPMPGASKELATCHSVTPLVAKVGGTLKAYSLFVNNLFFTF